MMTTCLQPVVFPRLHVIERLVRCGNAVVAGTAQLNREFQARYCIKADRTLDLSVPVKHVGEFISVNDATIDESARQWKFKHVRTVRHHYQSTPFFKMYFDEYEAMIDSAKGSFGEWAFSTMRWSVEKLDLHVKWVQDFDVCPVKPDDPNDWVIRMCIGVGADLCYCGASGYYGYMRPSEIEAGGLKLIVQDWTCPVYPQRGVFIENLSILDLLMNMGPDSLRICSSS